MEVGSLTERRDESPWQSDALTVRRRVCAERFRESRDVQREKAASPMELTTEPRKRTLSRRRQWSKAQGAMDESSIGSSMPRSREPLKHDFGMWLTDVWPKFSAVSSGDQLKAYSPRMRKPSLKTKWRM